MKRTIREIRKRENAVIRVNLIDVAGQRYIEIRQYIAAEMVSSWQAPRG